MFPARYRQHNEGKNTEILEHVKVPCSDMGKQPRYVPENATVLSIVSSELFFLEEMESTLYGNDLGFDNLLAENVLSHLTVRRDPFFILVTACKADCFPPSL